VYKRLVQLAGESKGILALRKGEINRYRSVLTSTTEANQQQVDTAVAEYFLKIHDAVSEAERQVHERLSSLRTQRDQTVHTYLVI
jgi:hypothetical protein